MRRDLSRIFHLRGGALEKKPEGRSELIPPQSNVDASAVKLGERNERDEREREKETENESSRSALESRIKAKQRDG